MTGLAAQPHVEEAIDVIRAHDVVTLLFAAHHEHVNDAVVLRDVLASRLKTPQKGELGSAQNVLASEQIQGVLVTDLRDRIPAHALVEKIVSLRGTSDLRDLPLGIVKPSADAMAWLRGIRGEQDAARRLAKIGPEWVVVNSVPVGEGESDIDHLVVGPGGVFTINSKRHRDKAIWVAKGTFLVDGFKQPHIRNTAFEAQRVEKALARRDVHADVVGVIAVSGAKSMTIKEPAQWKGRSVEVVSMERLTRRLARQRTLGPDQVAAIAEQVVRPETWSLRPQSSTDIDELNREFARIDRGTDRWRMFVALCAFAVTAGVAVAGFAIWNAVITG